MSTKKLTVTRTTTVELTDDAETPIVDLEAVAGRMIETGASNSVAAIAASDASEQAQLELEETQQFVTEESVDEFAGEVIQSALMDEPTIKEDVLAGFGGFNWDGASER